MVRPDQESIQTFMSITGFSEAAAIRKLEEHHGNLNEAVNAHFGERDRNIAQEASFAAPQDEVMDIDDLMPFESHGSRSSLPSFARDWNPFSVLDRNFVISDDVDGDDGDVDEDFPNVQIAEVDGHGNRGSFVQFTPSAPTIIDVPDYSNDTEEELIRAAIEASKQDAAMSNQQHDRLDLEDPTPQPVQSRPKEAELAHAVSLLLQIKKDLFGANDDEKLQQSEGSITRPHPSKQAPTACKTIQREDAGKQTPLNFEGKSFVDNHLRKCVQGMWNDLYKEIAGTPIESLSSFKDRAFYVLDEMKNFKSFDVSIIEESLKVLFAKATTYDEARSKSSEKATKELIARQLEKAKDRLHDAKAEESKEAKYIQTTKAKLEQVRKERDRLEEEEKNLSALLKQHEQLLRDAQAGIHGFEEDIVAINNTPLLDDDLIEELKTSKSDLEAAREELKNLNPFA